MSDSLDLFVDSRLPAERFASVVERVVGVSFKRREIHREQWSEVWWEGFKGRIRVSVSAENEFTNDTELNFEDFAHHIEIWAPSDGDEERDAYGRELFEAIKDLGLPCLLTWDAQRELARFDPRTT